MPSSPYWKPGGLDVERVFGGEGGVNDEECVGLKTHGVSF